MADEGKAGAPAPAMIPIDAASSSVKGQLVVAEPGPPPPANPKSARWPTWIWAGLVAFVFAAVGLWYLQPWASKGLAVIVETVVPAPMVRVLAVNGRIAPLHLVDLKPRVGGEVLAVLADEGAVVAQGDVLAQVDPSGQQAVVRQAMAGLDAGLVAQSQAAASLARAEALRDNISRTTLDDARSAQQTARQEVARLEALFDQAQIDLEKYTIVAPTAGTVLTRTAETGQSVDPATALFSMADLGQLVVETDVDEAYATQITAGLPAVLQLKGETTRRDGSVSFVAAQVDADTGGLAVKIAFDDPVTAPVGLTVTANIIVDRQAAAITIPRAAVVTDATNTAVFVVAADHAVRRVVTVVDWPADRVEVTTGLAAGDIVITDATGLSDGAAIAVSPPASAEP
jgi:RND family efflux transporter MFP subunit